MGTVMAYQGDIKQLHFDVMSAGLPLFRLFDAETAHNIALAVFSSPIPIIPKETRPDPSSLATVVWGRHFPNPIGVAAGFDKDARVAEPLLSMGFGFVEIGSVTPLPQPGNPKPRCFRLLDNKAIINRYGFNSDGADAVRERLLALRQRQADPNSHFPSGIVGVNLGKNKTSPDAASDYVIGVNRLAPYADYLVINVSSPNTPGLRALQGRGELEHLVKTVKKALKEGQWSNNISSSDNNTNNNNSSPPPLLVKIAPDLTQEDLVDVANVALRHGVDGLIVSNTTIARPDSVTGKPHADETGGLSGPPLFDMSTRVLSEVYKLTKGKIPIIGVGGVSSGKEAYAKVRAGAALIEVYTAFAYDGPALVPKIKKELAICLEKDGFSCIAEAVGADHRHGEKKKK